MVDEECVEFGGHQRGRDRIDAPAQPLPGHDDVGLGVRFWKRFLESSEDDDNPDIVDYLGHGELFLGYDRGSHRYGLMLRNPFEYPTVQLDWSYLLTDNVRLYVQYFNGYGESLIDYNRRANRIGVGFLLNEWP